MRTIRTLTLAYAAGLLTATAFLLSCPPESIVQFGLRLQAFQTEYVFDAAPKGEIVEAAMEQVQERRR